MMIVMPVKNFSRCCASQRIFCELALAKKFTVQWRYVLQLHFFL